MSQRKFRKKKKKKNLASQVRANKMKLARIAHEIEKKALTSSRAYAALATIHNQFFLNGCAPGTALNQRVGHKIKNVNLELNLYLESNTPTMQYIRVLVYWANCPKGVAPAPDLVPSDISANDARVLSTTNYITRRSEFSYLYDRIVRVSGGNADDFAYGKMSKIRLLLGKTTEFNNGVAGTVADVETNGLYLHLIVPTVNLVNCYWNMHLQFTDA